MKSYEIIQQLFMKCKTFVVAHKVATIITASVVGIGAVGGTAVAVIHNNDKSNAKTEVILEEGEKVVTNDDGEEVVVNEDGEEVAAVEDRTVETKSSSLLDKVTGKADTSSSTSKKNTTSNTNSSASSSGTTASKSNTTSSPSTASSGSSSSSASGTSSSGSTSSSSSTKTCSHDWVSKGVVHHDAVYETVDASWDEAIYETKYFDVCDLCGAKLYNDTERLQHIYNVHGGTGSCTTSSEQVKTGTVHHPDSFQALVTPASDDYSNAYYICSKCGEKKTY